MHLIGALFPHAHAASQDCCVKDRAAPRTIHVSTPDVFFNRDRTRIAGPAEREDGYTTSPRQDGCSTDTLMPETHGGGNSLETPPKERSALPNPISSRL